MPRKLPLHVERNRDRHGKVRFYFRRGKGSRTPLPADPTSSEFLEAWQACMTGIVPERPAVKLQRVIPGSIAALIASYMRSPSYVELRASSKKGYATRLRQLQDDHGHRLVAQMTRGAIIERVLQPYAGKPGAGIDVLKKLRILIRHAIALGWLKHDPSLGIRRPKGDEIRSWTDAEIAQFEATWPLGTRQRTAFALHLFTGQRVSDVHRMTWTDVAGDSVRVVQQKTNAKLAIAIHPELAEALERAERAHVVIISTAYDKPFSVKGYGQWMRAAITKAGLPLDCQPHGLRKAAGRRLAQAEVSTRGIMAVLGHKTLAEAERYTREVEQERAATVAIARLPDRRGTPIPKPLPQGLGRTAKKRGG